MNAKKYPILTDRDIINNPYAYDPETLEWNIINSFLSLRKLVRYQKLTPYICAKYVVFGGRNEMYADCTEDAWISTDEIPGYQPHITIEEMQKAHVIANQEDMEEDGIFRKLPQPPVSPAAPHPGQALLGAAENDLMMNEDYLFKIRK